MRLAFAHVVYARRETRRSLTFDRRINLCSSHVLTAYTHPTCRLRPSCSVTPPWLLTRRNDGRHAVPRRPLNLGSDWLDTHCQKRPLTQGHPQQQASQPACSPDDHPPTTAQLPSTHVCSHWHPVVPLQRFLASIAIPTAPSWTDIRLAFHDINLFRPASSCFVRHHPWQLARQPTTETSLPPDRSDEASGHRRLGGMKRAMAGTV